MIDLYQPFTNPISRETFRCTSFTEESYTMDWIVAPGGFVPFEHIHTNQDELFHVKQGELRAKVDGREHVGVAGETVIVKRGSRHIGRNEKNEALVCVVEYKPGLDCYTAFQCFAGLTIDNDMTRDGIPNPMKMLYFLRRMNAQTLARPAFIPDFLFKLLMETFYVIGTVAGWEKLYKKYTEPATEIKSIDIQPS